jgi:F0F1-type ATP synthase assembly protein I
MWKVVGSTGYLGFFILLWFLAGYYGGQWLDRRFGTEPWFKWVGLGVGLLAGANEIARVIKQYNKSLKEDDGSGPKTP